MIKICLNLFKESNRLDIIYNNNILQYKWYDHNVFFDTPYIYPDPTHYTNSFIYSANLLEWEE